MSDSPNSILYACTRSFLSTLSAMAALGVGIIIITLVGSAILTNIEGDGGFGHELESKFLPVIVPNAHDARIKLANDSPVMLKLNINGVIGLSELNAHSFREQLVEANEDVLEGRVKGLLIHIDSPGGTVTDADGIYHAIKEYKEKHKVPVYAYVDGLCASGGMYIASAADKIFASDVSLIGSVGVLFSPFFNFSELLKKIGVETKTLTAGIGKDEMNPFRPWKPDEEKSLKPIIDYYYTRFVDIVASSRPHLDRNKLIREYGAQVFPAAVAKEFGFIDESGYTLNDAKRELAKAMGVEDDKYQVVKLEHKISISDFFGSGSEMMKSGLTHKLELPAMFSPKLMNQFLYLYSPH